jgi:hypothetical protein
MDMVALWLMEQYGRSYEQYENTPQDIIELAIEKNNIDAKLSHNK